MKWSYTTWHEWACGTHLRPKSDHGSPVAKTGLTHETNSSTVQWPRSSNRMSQTPEDNSSNNGKHRSLRKVAIRNVFSDHPSPTLRKTLPAIPIYPAPVIQNRVCPISPAEAAGPTYHQHHGFQRKPTKANRETGSAPAASVDTTKCTFVPNMARQTHLNRTPAVEAAITANKVNTKSHSTRSSKTIRLPLTVSFLTGEAG